MQSFRIWGSRIFFTILFLNALFHISENIWGMTILALVAGLIACYIFEDKICLFDDRIEFKRKFIFGFYNKRSVFFYCEIIKVFTNPEERNEQVVDLVSGYNLKKQIYIVTITGKTILIRTVIDRTELRRFMQEVNRNINKVKV